MSSLKYIGSNRNLCVCPSLSPSDLHLLRHALQRRVRHPQRLLLPGQRPRQGEDQAGRQQERAALRHEGRGAGARRHRRVSQNFTVSSAHISVWDPF